MRCTVGLASLVLFASFSTSSTRARQQPTPTPTPAAPQSSPAAQPTPTPAPQATPAPAPATPKANQRPVVTSRPAPEPFDGATVEQMAAQCVTLQTDTGEIELEMLPEVAPEAVRNFLNLSATGAFDTTTFSRVVTDFVIQGGNLSTREKVTVELARRSRRTIPDEPSEVRHVRGIVSMA
ncbi:MAG TPA: peptidylprolyl isomerase, partial [Pyrinomonadaceae bacterium]|nr:peptidylprolyl isomerase [Pyrinomonadaceae bacterium]